MEGGLGSLTERLAAAFRARVGELARAEGVALEPDELVLIGQVGGEGARIERLVTGSGFAKTRVTRLVATLEKAGHVERATDVTNKRLKVVRLTGKGRRAAAAIARARAATEREWELALGPGRAERLDAMLSTLLLRASGVPEAGFRNRYERRATPLEDAAE